MKTALFVATAAASVVASADAGFAGFVAFSRNVGANPVIDVFAAVDNAGDKFLNVYNTSSNGVFVQKAGLASKTWKPDAANFTSTRNVSDDSFMTAGTYSGGAYGGEYYASGNTNGDPNFTGNSWIASPASLAATTIPTLAGWYTGDPPSVDNNAELLSGAVAGGTACAGGTASAPASAFGASRSLRRVSAFHAGSWYSQPEVRCANFAQSGTNGSPSRSAGFGAGAPSLGTAATRIHTNSPSSTRNDTSLTANTVS